MIEHLNFGDSWDPTVALALGIAAVIISGAAYLTGGPRRHLRAMAALAAVTVLDGLATGRWITIGLGAAGLAVCGWVRYRGYGTRGRTRNAHR